MHTHQKNQFGSTYVLWWPIKMYASGNVEIIWQSPFKGCWGEKSQTPNTKYHLLLCYSRHYQNGGSRYLENSRSLTPTVEGDEWWETVVTVCCTECHLTSLFNSDPNQSIYHNVKIRYITEVTLKPKSLSWLGCGF